MDKQTLEGGNLIGKTSNLSHAVLGQRKKLAPAAREDEDERVILYKSNLSIFSGGPYGDAQGNWHRNPDWLPGV